MTSEISKGHHCRNSLGLPSEAPSGLPSGAPSTQPTTAPGTNVLIITADQLRYDALRFIQDRMPIYNNYLKVNTPNIDRLANQGVYFENAYAQSSLCVPSRGTMRSGCTVERHGLGSNELPNDGIIDTIKERKLEAIRTYDQMLSSVGYQVETYGKLHVPIRWMYQDALHTKKAISYTGYSLDFETPLFSEDTAYKRLRKQINAWMERDGKEKIFARYQRTNPTTLWPYTPTELDPQHDSPVPGAGEGLYGIDSLPSNYSLSAYTGMEGKLAIRRLAKSDQPWCLTVSFSPPRKLSSKCVPAFGKCLKHRCIGLRKDWTPVVPTIQRVLLTLTFGHRPTIHCCCRGCCLVS